MKKNHNLFFEVSEDLVSSKIDENIIILNIKSGKYIEVKGSGVFIWELIQEGFNTEEKILHHLIKIFDEDNAVLENDLNIFLNDAFDKGLLNEATKNK